MAQTRSETAAEETARGAGLNATLHHVGVATADAAREARDWQETLGLVAVSSLIHDPVQKVNVLFLSDGKPNGTLLELVEPAAPGSPVDRFLNQQNRAYHVCYEVDDLDAALRQVRAQGALVLGAPAPAVAYHGRRIAWCYTHTRNLVELLERGP